MKQGADGPPNPAFSGLDALDHLLALEQGFSKSRAHALTSSGGELGDLSKLSRSVPQFDVVLAGGGLSLIYAATLARAGLRVCVFDRGRIGFGHREWNISKRELLPLVVSGLFTQEEVDALIAMQYRIGICRFAEGPAYPVRNVLDCVIDAAAFLQSLRRIALDAGATLLEMHALTGYRVAHDGVYVETASVAAPAQRRGMFARLFIDALGAHSPHARFDLCCPTVGGVMEGLTLGTAPQELDPEVGEILITTEGIEEEQQHIWEGFPAPKPGAMTIYLFYYQRAEQLRDAIAAGEHPLLGLYERFFSTLPRYKSGTLQLVRPTYGYIPAYTRLGPMPATPNRRVLLVGDAAARHSPLTFCGFGSMIRSFWPISQGLIRLLAKDELEHSTLHALWTNLEPPALQVMGGLTLMMMPSVEDALAHQNAINQLLNAAFATLLEQGDSTYAAFLQDEVDAPSFVRFMLATAARHPAVYRQIFRHLTPQEAVTWLARLAKFRWRSTGKRR